MKTIFNENGEVVGSETVIGPPPQDLMTVDGLASLLQHFNSLASLTMAFHRGAFVVTIKPYAPATWKLTTENAVLETAVRMAIAIWERVADL